MKVTRRAYAFLALAAGLLLRCACSGQEILASVTLHGDGGFAVVANQLIFQFGYSPSSLPPTNTIFETVPFTSSSIGQPFTITQLEDPDFNLIVQKLTDGLPELVWFVAELPGSGLSSQSSFESAFFAPLPLGPDAVDFEGYRITGLSLRLDQLVFDTPGSNPNRDGVWTDFSYIATVSVIGEFATGLGALLPGQPRTNSVPPGRIAYYTVEVPTWVQFATNSLLTASAPLNILFNQNTPPSGTNAGDYLLIGPATNGSFTLSAASTPTFQPGRRYYLGVQNTTAVPVTYAIKADFDVAPLSNGVPVTSTLNPGTLPRHFYYDVSSNAAAVSFKLYNLSGNVDLMARKGPPPPTLDSYDYGSFNSAALEDEIVVFTNSRPVALSPGRWYLSVFNQAAVPVTYTIVATEFTSALPSIIDLTNGIPYFNTNAGPMGALDYYRYHVTPVAVRAQFEVTGPDSDVTLVARKGLPLPNLATFDYISAKPGTNDELIVLFTNSAPVALSGGDWFLAVANLTALPVSYAIKATEWPAGSAPALVITNIGVFSNSVCLTWTSRPGEQYHVAGLTNLNRPNWVTVSPTITAPADATTWCLALPSPFQFFRVLTGPAPGPAAPPVFTGFARQTNGILIGWSGSPNVRYELDWTPVLLLPTWMPFTNIFTSPTGLFSFLDDGTQTGRLGVQRFYRVVQLP